MLLQTKNFKKNNRLGFICCRGEGGRNMEAREAGREEEAYMKGHIRGGSYSRRGQFLRYLLSD